MVFVPWAAALCLGLAWHQVGDLFGSVEEAFESATKRWPTKRLTELVLDAQVSHPPPLAQGAESRCAWFARWREPTALHYAR